MSLSLTKTYATGSPLTKTQLDTPFGEIETKFNTTLIAGSEIQASAIATSNIADSAVTTTKINDLGVTTGKINDLAVTAGKLAADAVTTVKLLDANVTTAKILDANITTAKLADASVTQAKRAALGQQVSSSSSNFSTTSSSYVDVTNLSVTVTSTGRPVFVGLIPATAATTGDGIKVEATSGTPTNIYSYLQFLNGSTGIGELIVIAQGAASASLGNGVGTNPWTIDVSPSVGSNTYKLQAKTGTVNTKIWCADYKLVAFEL